MEVAEDPSGGPDCGRGGWGQQMGWRRRAGPCAAMCSQCTRPGRWPKKWVGLKYSPGPAFLAVGCISSEKRAPFYDLSIWRGAKTPNMQALECPPAREGKKWGAAEFKQREGEMGRTALAGIADGKDSSLWWLRHAFCSFSCIDLTISCFLVSKFQYVQKQVRKGKDSEKTPISHSVSEQKIAALNPGTFLGHR